MTKNYTWLLRVLTVIIVCFWNLPSFSQNKSLLNANKKVVTRYFDEVIHSQKLNRMEDLFSKASSGTK
jgi:Gpi18-like mannosyltransferase